MKLEIPMSGRTVTPAVKVGTLNNGGNNFDDMRKRLRGIEAQEPGCIEPISVKETDGFMLMNNDGIRK